MKTWKPGPDGTKSEEDSFRLMVPQEIPKELVNAWLLTHLREAHCEYLAEGEFECPSLRLLKVDLIPVVDNHYSEIVDWDWLAEMLAS